MYCARFTYHTLNRRTIAEIRRNITEKGRWNPLSLISRLFRAKNEKKTIGAWRLDLDGFLRIFNVCSFDLTWSSLIVPFQTTLAMDTDSTVFDMRYDVSKIPEDICGQVRSVSASHIQSIDTRILTYSRTGPN